MDCIFFFFFLSFPCARCCKVCKMCYCDKIISLCTYIQYGYQKRRIWCSFPICWRVVKNVTWKKTENFFIELKDEKHQYLLFWYWFCGKHFPILCNGPEIKVAFVKFCVFDAHIEFFGLFKTYIYSTFVARTAKKSYRHNRRHGEQRKSKRERGDVYTTKVQMTLTLAV